MALIGTDDVLASRLERAGHHVEWRLVPWDELSEFDLIVISVGEEDLPDVIHRLESVVTPRQIVIHSAVGVGADILLDLPSLGIAMSVFGDEFVVSTCDEISQTVAAVLVSELGGNLWVISDDERRDLARALELARQSNELRREALRAARSETARNIVIRQMGGWR